MLTLATVNVPDVVVAPGILSGPRACVGKCLVGFRNGRGRDVSDFQPLRLDLHYGGYMPKADVFCEREDCPVLWDCACEKQRHALRPPEDPYVWFRLV